VDDLRAMKSEDVGLIVRAVSFQHFQLVVMIHQRHRQTDDMLSQDHTLHYSALHGKKINKNSVAQ